MPNLYKYFGIIFKFYSNDHEPIHIHAEYNKNIVKVTFHQRDGQVYRITYKVITSKFPAAKLTEVKRFCSLMKYNIIDKWRDYFINHKPVSCQNVTIKI